MKGRILIIEDDKDIADIIIIYLNKEGAETVWAEDGEKGLAIFNKEPFDLVLLDINLPGIDGFETLQKMRYISKIPVIILSARQEDTDMILGFGTGADDYVTKPFSPSVLIARIRAHLRRSDNSKKDGEEILSFGEFRLDRKLQSLCRGNKTVNLSPREMDILIFLTKSPGKSYTQEELYKEIWGNDFGDLSTVSVHIRRLRQKLNEDSSSPKFIKTKYGYGYFFKGEQN